MKKILFLITIVFSSLYSYDFVDTDGFCRETNPTYGYDNQYFNGTYLGHKPSVGECQAELESRILDNPILTDKGYLFLENFKLGSYYCVFSGTVWTFAQINYNPLKSCSAGQFLEAGSCNCVPDEDGDGTPDKCDPDYPDFANLDCDGNGVLNGVDSDIDGDGLLNSEDSNPYDSENSESIFEKLCEGPNLSLANPGSFQLYEYEFYSNITPEACNNLIFTDSKIDAVFSVPDKSSACDKNSYCYIHRVKNNCDVDILFYKPDGYQWVYNSTLVTELSCEAAVDNVNYDSHSFATVDNFNCPVVNMCFLHKKDYTPPPDDSNSEDSDSTMQPPDLNSTTNDLAPLLQASNTTNKHLDDLKNKTDITNNNLDDLKNISSDILNNGKGIKSGLDGIKSGLDGIKSGQNNSLIELKNLNSINKKMSDTITSNQGVINGSLESIDSKMTTNNDLLSDSTGFLSELRDYFLEDSNTSSDGDLNFLNSEIGSILSKYTITLGSSSCGTVPTISTTLHGKNLIFLNQDTINKLPVADMKAVIIFLFTILGLSFAFRGN